jgi:hypothetical protein
MSIHDDQATVRLADLSRSPCLVRASLLITSAAPVLIDAFASRLGLARGIFHGHAWPRAIRVRVISRGMRIAPHAVDYSSKIRSVKIIGQNKGESCVS